jgi:hypothetical protein
MSPVKPKKPIPVSVATDELVHLAPPALGNLLMGLSLNTLCEKPVMRGLQGRSMDQTGERCPICYSMIDAYGYSKT